MQQAAALLFLAVVAFEPFGYRAAAQRADTSRTVAQQLASFVAANDLLRRVVVDPSVVENDLLTCKFYLVGNVLNSPVDCTSPDLSSRATGIANASINCTGPTVNATFQGGQALAGFTSGFSGRMRQVPARLVSSPHGTACFRLAVLRHRIGTRACVGKPDDCFVSSIFTFFCFNLSCFPSPSPSPHSTGRVKSEEWLDSVVCELQALHT